MSASRTLRHNLRCSVIDGTAYMVMLGLAETFFPLFVLAIEPDEGRARVASGLIVAAPVMLASIAQLSAPGLVARVRSYRVVVSACAALQTLACLAFAIVALRGSAPLPLLFLIASAYHAGAVVAGSTWSALMGVLVPAGIRPRFFGSRNRTLQFGAIAGLITGAVLLEFASSWTQHSAWSAASRVLGGPGTTSAAMRAFAVLFALACVARAISALYLYKHIEPAHAAANTKALPLRELLLRLRTSGLGRLILALALCQCTMMVASPFWAAFARERAGASFLEWAGLIAIWFLGKALAMRHAGHIAKTRGKRALLLTGWACMIPVPALWAISTNLVWMAFAQLVAGVAIAMWESATWLSVLEAAPEQERTSLLAKNQLLQWVAGTIGAVIGGLVLDKIPDKGGAFAAIFVLSTVLRAGAFFILRHTAQHALVVSTTLR